MSHPESMCVKWYQRCGLASLEDLESADLKELLSFLEDSQEDFLSRESLFRSQEYNWPTDALHFVARPWEYSYVASHLLKWQGEFPSDLKLRVLDFGSGVTFFPFTLARSDIDVTAVDIDPVVGRDFEAAISVTSVDPGTLRFVLSSSDNRIDEADMSFDCIYSVSVFEHISDPIAALRELHRLLKPGGHLVATFDVCLRGGKAFNPDQFREFMAVAHREFDPVYPERTIHPSSVLACYNGPYPYRVQSYLKSPLERFRYVMKIFVRRIVGLPPPPVDYAFMGIVLRKRH